MTSSSGCIRLTWQTQYSGENSPTQIHRRVNHLSTLQPHIFPFPPSLAKANIFTTRPESTPFYILRASLAFDSCQGALKQIALLQSPRTDGMGWWGWAAVDLSEKHYLLRTRNQRPVSKWDRSVIAVMGEQWDGKSPTRQLSWGETAN